uniref:Protein translocase subunit SecY n=1 Tax=Ceramothamnion japonicum TaxID=218448 RepID=A0A1C9CDI6_CERJP|nr:preprotein translocase subunit SecY [Ceramium japonicum]AOM66458.1 preprotein translocase subunit SecY [Ceramium japonicum]
MKTNNALLNKISITLGILVLARIGIFIPVIGIDHESLNNTIQQNGLINFLNIFSGGGFSTIGIFALGIVPYINSSIIMQLIIKIIPDLENLQKNEGEIGRQKINQITRYLTLIWGLIQSTSIAIWIKPYVFNWNNIFILDCIIALTTGSIITMWFSEIISEYGIGNGASLLIFQNIVSSIPKNFQDYIKNFNNEYLIIYICCISIFCVSILIINILIQEGKRKITILSTKQLSTIQQIRSQSYIPLKLNQGGVMPIVFASAAITLPTYLYNILNNTQLANILYLFAQDQILYLPLYLALIIVFNYLYTSIILNPEDISTNLKKMGVSIPNIRPGSETVNYLKRIISRLTFVGSLFLFSIALLPTLIYYIFKLNTLKGLGATSLLILVGVAIDTAKQIQTYIISQQYDNMM